MVSPTPPGDARGAVARVRVRRLEHGHDLPLPEPATAAAAGCDLRAAVSGTIVLEPAQRLKVPTGLCFEIPPGWEAQIRPRSGLAIRHGITVLNSPGTIDADYRGEVAVLLINLGSAPFTIARGDRIAQVVLSPVATTEWEERQELGGSARGAAGFGSSGNS